jgi:hypothetical protein
MEIKERSVQLQELLWGAAERQKEEEEVGKNI